MTLEAWVNPTSRTGFETAVLKERSTSGLAYGIYTSNGDQSPSVLLHQHRRIRFERRRNHQHHPQRLDPPRRHLRRRQPAPLRQRRPRQTTRRHRQHRRFHQSRCALAATPSGANILAGKLDEIRIYNRALTPTEIQTDMNTPVGTPTPDTTAPTVSVTSPLDAANVSASINLAANAADNVGVAGVQFLLDGNTLGAEDTTSPYSLTWDTTTAANGAHVITARARDAAGNATTSAPINVTVNNIQDVAFPSVAVTSPLDAASVTGTIPVSADASDDVGVVGVQFKLDGNVLGTEDTTAPYSVNWNTTAAVNGPHTLTATARDAAGHVTVSTLSTSPSPTPTPFSPPSP